MMIACALAFCAYSLFGLFTAENGLTLAVSSVRLGLVMMAIVSFRYPSGVLISGALLLFSAVVLGAMVVMRKEVQLKDDQR